MKNICYIWNLSGLQNRVDELNKFYDGEFMIGRSISNSEWKIYMLHEFFQKWKLSAEFRLCL